MIRRRLMQLAVSVFAAISVPLVEGNEEKEGYVERRKAYLAKVLAEPAQKIWNGPRWEYVTLWVGHPKTGKESMSDMNVLGSQGWEMFAVDGSYYCFKRPLAAVLNPRG